MNVKINKFWQNVLSIDNKINNSSTVSFVTVVKLLAFYSHQWYFSFDINLENLLQLVARRSALF